MTRNFGGKPHLLTVLVSREPSFRPKNDIASHAEEGEFLKFLLLGTLAGRRKQDRAGVRCGQYLWITHIPFLFFGEEESFRALNTDEPMSV